MLDSDAMGRVVNILAPEAFSILAHQQIYQALFELYHQHKPTDLLTDRYRENI